MVSLWLCWVPFLFRSATSIYGMLVGLSWGSTGVRVVGRKSFCGHHEKLMAANGSPCETELWPCLCDCREEEKLNKRTPCLLVVFSGVHWGWSLVPRAMGEALYTNYSLRPPWLPSKCFDLSNDPEGGMCAHVHMRNRQFGSCFLGSVISVFFESGLEQLCSSSRADLELLITAQWPILLFLNLLGVLILISRSYSLRADQSGIKSFSVLYVQEVVCALLTGRVMSLQRHSVSLLDISFNTLMNGPAP